MAKARISIRNLDDDQTDVMCAALAQLAHDMNNLLTPLIAYPSLIKMELPADGHGRQMLSVIEKTSRDLIHMTRQLLQFASRIQGDVSEVDVVETVNHVINDARRSRHCSESIGLKVESESGLPKSPAHETLVVGAVASVLSNALDAVDGKGSIRIRVYAHKQESAKATACGLTLKPGAYVVVRIDDSGAGVPEELRDTIFDPFVTSKKSAEIRGAGMGLSIAYLAVRRLGGAIDYVSTAGKGSSFFVYFPAVSQGGKQ